jgi:hypothetical protein
MNKKFFVACMLILVAGAGLCFASSSDEVDFGDFTLEIDGVSFFNDTEDGMTSYTFLLNGENGGMINIITSESEVSQDEALQNSLNKGYKKVENVNDFEIIESPDPDDDYEYMAMHVSEGNTAIGIFFNEDDMDLVKDIIESYEDK